MIDRRLAYPEDCIRIAHVLLDHGYYYNPLESQTLWNRVSAEQSLFWLVLGSDEEVWAELAPYVTQ